jgi:hypothetical protein
MSSPALSGLMASDATVDGFGFWGNALLGAIVTVVLSFVPFSPVLGGATAGYLEGPDRRAGVRVGAVSGAIASLPLMLLVVGVAFLVPIGVTVADVGFGVPVLVLLLLLGVLLLVAAYGAGLGALGGYVGAAVAERRARDARSDAPEDDELFAT